MFSVKNYQKGGTIKNKAEDYNHKNLERGTYKEETNLNIPLGKYFKERIDIHPLLPYEGDNDDLYLSLGNHKINQGTKKIYIDLQIIFI